MRKLQTLSSERLFFSSPNQLRRWVTIGFGRDAVPFTIAAGCASVKLKNCTAVGASWAVAWVAVLHLGAQPMAA